MGSPTPPGAPGSPHGAPMATPGPGGSTQDPRGAPESKGAAPGEAEALLDLCYEMSGKDAAGIQLLLNRHVSTKFFLQLTC